MKHNIQLSEEELLNDIFGEPRTYKQKYKLYWCDTCKCTSIVCPECNNGSCTGGGCNKCTDEFIDFCKNKSQSVFSVLSSEEYTVYNKILILQNECLDKLKDK